ncbi:Zinc finger protein PLAGL1 [Gracilariopsis chorda]|uniref:Zinc finger protein PLAGL1 n=1 Tax=Gracilariopsis chorda TaxID=448386 RepID=A0A2V3IR77_9FLOR|nr:Zinc finger protein PLAGL1 [Gracilariopsis chorda]|eukprot:PXF44604.1 Zinc finger protein PLAGL1 [Gracilariopsis chorda]
MVELLGNMSPGTLAAHTTIDAAEAQNMVHPSLFDFVGEPIELPPSVGSSGGLGPSRARRTPASSSGAGPSMAGYAQPASSSGAGPSMAGYAQPASSSGAGPSMAGCAQPASSNVAGQSTERWAQRPSTSRAGPPTAVTAQASSSGKRPAFFLGTAEEQGRKTSRTNACRKCSRRFNTYMDASAHQQICRKEHTCDHCGYKTPSKALMDRHMRSHSERHECFECNRVFATRYALTSHLRAQHGNQNRPQRFTCEYCGNTYGRARSMHRHIAKAHSGSTSPF